MIIKNILIEKYNQKGEGVAFLENKPVYIFGTIVGEIVHFKIILKHKNYFVGELVEVIKSSPNRSKLFISNAHEIGGYELVHMNDIEQKKFKISRVKDDFWKIAKINLLDIEFFQGVKKFYYRNKITLHDGYFFKKNSHEKIEIQDYLLANIPYDRTRKGNIIYRQLDTLISGEKKDKIYTTDSMLGYKFRVGINSFYQINKEVATEAYNDIKKYVIKDGITVDLYAGIATITIIVSSVSNKVYGVEVNKFSYNDAIYNIKYNNIHNIEFHHNNVQKWIANNKTLHVDTLILDPSREGVDKSTLNIIIKNIKPKRIIYLSCNPGTQASNINILKNNYKLVKFKLYDMFPQTYHIESLAVLDLLS